MWTYQGKPFVEADIGNFVGFVYEITDTVSGRKYIGQKVFWNKVVRPPLKGKTKKRHSRKPSDWQVYYGSNQSLLDEISHRGTDHFTREILVLCESKAMLNYSETKMILVKDALLKDDYFNDWVSAKITKRSLVSVRSSLLAQAFPTH